MTDYSDLKKLAEAAPPGPWMYWGETANEIFGAPSGNSNVRKRVFMASWDYKSEIFEFIAAANPAVVLELLAKIDELENHILEMGERDR